ncbi:DUF1983 domain-containing protein, partial [Citrobacter freundii]|nr:DUF1983 domain-containing protein [Citrobacter freundii]MCW1448975.1 DUF1983 domain-containing protein [Citrobacter freundii]
GIVRNGVKYSTGFGMSIEPSGNSYKSTVVFAADQFGIYSGSEPGNYQAAFFTSNGQVFINNAFIDYASITLAKVGSWYSANYVAGRTGTIMKSDGTFEVNGAVAGEGATKMTNLNYSVKDDNGVLRVQIGKLTGVF